MNRTIPENVKSILRKEVNFGCPLPDCGSPMLTWHHFDPPWHIQRHHFPKGMIALCHEHHAMADQGIFSNEQLHGYKSNPNQLQFIKNKFLWYPESSIIRMGGCYADNWCEVLIKERPMLEIKKDSDGLSKISFILFDESGQLIANMDKNEFTIIPERVHDFIVTASSNRIKIWYKKRSVGFELHFSRKTMKEIESILDKDKRQSGIDIKHIDLKSLYEKLSDINDIESLFPICMQEEMTETFVRWHAIKKMGTDGKVPFINFEKCNLYFQDRNIKMTNGRILSDGIDATFCFSNRFSDIGMG